ncbi:hypothetical protein [Paludibacterium purpuratum]|uniref:Uncharacterized protein n=1 Tax=Paludibacterium purpuratum TaxID=1144873 RepID=A0A4R7AZQ3_9NEIS|nr:hypothetical protein [Paludibacterium purpuratum]TDR73909.1 hypothetical protein DFP86_112113 [Paludibacterium purpuratum]
MKPQQGDQPYSISVVGGEPMDAEPLALFARPVEAHLMYRNNSAPVEGESITFVVMSSGSLDRPKIRRHGGEEAWDVFAAVTTDARGNASVDARAGSDVGAFQLKVQHALAYNTPVYQALRVSGAVTPPPQVSTLTITQGDRQTGFKDDQSFSAAVQVQAKNWAGQGVENASVLFTIGGNTGTKFEDSDTAEIRVLTTVNGRTIALPLIPGSRPGRLSISASCPDSPQCPPVQFDLALAPPVGDFHFCAVSEPVPIPHGSIWSEPFCLQDNNGGSWPYIPVDAVIETGYPSTFFFGTPTDKHPSILVYPEEASPGQYRIPVTAVDQLAPESPDGALRLSIHGHVDAWKSYRLQFVTSRH